MKKITSLLAFSLFSVPLSHAAVLASYSFTGGSLAEDSGSIYASDATLPATSVTIDTVDPITMDVTSTTTTVQFVTNNDPAIGDIDTITSTYMPNGDFYSAAEFTYTVSDLASDAYLIIDSASINAISRPGGNGRRLSFAISENGSNFNNLGGRGNSSIGVNLDDSISTTQFVNGDTFTIQLQVRDTVDNGTYILDDLTLNGTIIPEPSSVALLGLGGAALLLRRRRV
ncbi:PEP-CTERM sorting domain-containing protein [Luteolibacter sp. AS25]|uniref:PEP-CTERM sorting domain-containing protein n=1 Tax=Luteolibacter sp. AS25 TaxID=3135776 RepID=UPI00398B976A